MKKALLIVFVCVFAFLCMPTAGADEVTLDGALLEGEYYAKFSFANITSINNSLTFEFRVLIDEGFTDTESGGYLALSSDSDNQAPEPLKSIGEAFASSGYVVSGEGLEIIATRTFDSFTDYSIASGEDGYTLDKSDREIVISKKGLLYNYMSYESVSVFSNLTPEVLTEENLLGFTLSKLDEYGIPLEQVLFEYLLGTPYSNKILDSNAPKKFQDKATLTYYHQVYMDIDNNSKPLEITRRVPNTAIWYVGAALAGFAVAFIPLMIALAKRNKEI